MAGMDQLVALNERYGLTIDFNSIENLVKTHGLDSNL